MSAAAGGTVISATARRTSPVAINTNIKIYIKTYSEISYYI